MNKDIIKKANYCLSCKNKPCINGYSLSNDIPNSIYKIKNQEYEDVKRDVITFLFQRKIIQIIGKDKVSKIEVIKVKESRNHKKNIP
jgi:hypothetical protein